MQGVPAAERHLASDDLRWWTLSVAFRAPDSAGANETARASMLRTVQEQSSHFARMLTTHVGDFLGTEVSVAVLAEDSDMSFACPSNTECPFPCFAPTLTEPCPTPGPPHEPGSNRHLVIWLCIGGGVLLVLLCCLVAGYCFCVKPVNALEPRCSRPKLDVELAPVAKPHDEQR
mmetsp:Transcript_95863/g.271221  ORF Transcript_95863/g.271221 Transcript_95863/m.271221 type:complete len:174 (+) Transcript_95863:1-522(+)